MKRLFFFTIILLSISAFAQDKVLTKNKRFYLGVNFSPDYCNRVLTKNSDTIHNDVWKRAKNMLDSIEVPKFSYTAGISFGYQIKHWLSIETGIQYSNKGYKTIPVMTLFDFNQDPAMATNIINLTYLDIPVKVNFFFLKKKIQLYASTGAVFNILLKSTVKTVPKTPTANFPVQTTSYYSYNKLNISPSVAVGLQYNIMDRLFLRVEPVFRYGIIYIEKDAEKKTYLWNAGININVSFKL